VDALIARFRAHDAAVELDQPIFQRRTLDGRIEMVRRITTREGGRLVISTDVTEITDAHTALARGARMTALGQLVTGVAHEVNTPLGTAVTAATHLQAHVAQLAERLHDGRVTRADLTRFVELNAAASALLVKNLTRAADLVTSFKRISVDQSSDERRLVALHDYLGDIARSLEPQLQSAGHRLSIACPPGIVLDLYAGALAQIVTNLVLNSIAHAFAPGQHGTLALTAQRGPDGTIELVYRDDGRGVAPIDLPNIFEPFFTTRRGAGHAGLGLSVVYNLVTQRLDGTIDAVSEPGEGLALRIVLPAPLSAAPALVRSAG
ncbi:MAG: HAMP domain-containing histidine kinase, partial [Alphaproteobacteria bacterium]|nr:HAMP domain-containing histidine kinase [Alphaproteobacteria bacterium]